MKNDKNEKDFFVFLSLIPQNSIVLDIGANIGIMTVHIAQSIKDVFVYSFEPVPNNIHVFKRIINHYKLNNVKLFEVALGNTEGKIEMVMPVLSNVKMQGLSHVVDESITEFNEGIKFKVPLKKLDTLNELVNANKKISAIKIDVENYEHFVLDGAQQLISKHKPVVYAELWENENREKCFQLFKKLNYQTYIVNNLKLEVFDYSIHKTQNFIFKPL